MNLVKLTNDVVYTCDGITKSAVHAIKAWTSTTELVFGLKEGAFSRDLVVNKLWESKSIIQNIIDSMVQKMSNVHLLISGALASMKHNEQREAFLQTVLEPMLKAQMAGHQANEAADTVTKMLQDLLNHKEET